MNNYIEKVLFTEDLLGLIAKNCNYGRSKLNQVCHAMHLPLFQIINDLIQTKKFKLLEQWNIKYNIFTPKFLILTGIIAIPSSSYFRCIQTTPLQWLHKGIARTYNNNYLLGKPSQSYIDTKFFNANLNWYKAVLQAWYNLIIHSVIIH